MNRSPQTEDVVSELLDNESWEDLRALLKDLHPADAADIINHAPSESRSRIFSLVQDSLKADVLSELENISESCVIESLDISEIGNILEKMAPDDAADFLGNLPPEQAEQILKIITPKNSQSIRKLLKYDEETAGGIMTTDVVAMRENQTVQEAIQAIAYIDTHEPFFYANIIDGQNRLIGYVDIWELLREKNRDRLLKSLVHKDSVAARVDMDREEVANLMNRYDLSAIPVVDRKGKLVGRITGDDIIDVMEEEASEDILRLAGSDNAELETESPLKVCMVRLPWLFITLLGGFVTTLILKAFHAHIGGARLLMMAYFVPIVLAMGGNTGIQSSTLTVRKIALEDVRASNVWSLLFREMLTGILMGVVCGIIIGFWAGFVVDTDSGGFPPAFLALTVAAALFSAMTFAAVFGAFVPVVLEKAGIDPAVASGPFVTVTNDISALLIYFAVTVLLVQSQG